MIEDLTLEKLKEYGFDEMQIDNLINSNDYQIPLQTNKGQFFATSAEMKIYSGVDALQKILFTENDVRFPIMDFDLLPEYFDRKLQKYLIEQKALLGKSFDESIVKKNFIKNEIDETNIKINFIVEKGFAVRLPEGGHAKDLKKYQYYIEWLNNLNETNPTPETLATPSSQSENIKKTITVNCKPAEFAELLKMLQNKGWINIPKSGEGVANSLLKIFEFAENKPSKESLGRNFASDTYTISIEKIKELQKIPSLQKINNTN